MSNELATRWDGCANNPDSCSATQGYLVTGYQSDFVIEIAKTPSFFANGNGAFVYSCFTHCGATSDDFFRVAINNITMHDALVKWWNSENEPADQHTFLPCLRNSGHECNPTC
jgi:hypothetical protein